MRYRAVLAYDGTDFQGFQKLTAERRSVVGTLEAALHHISGEQIKVMGAGRTDAGVHALGQVVAFDVGAWRHSDATLLQAINATLPSDMAILRLERTAPDFHPRFEARRRSYHYLVYEAPIRHPLMARTHWYTRPNHGVGLAVDKMNAAAAHLVGTHDFASFGTPPEGDSATGNSVRTLFHSVWTAAPSSAGRVLVYRIEATAFLYHMVRTIVHALVDVGADRLSIDSFLQGFRAKERRRFPKLAPAHGLTLTEVTYDESGTTPAGEQQHAI
jgi:tRNA pseudouridine38-40 synthase